jgi:hypothetical protein
MARIGLLIAAAIAAFAIAGAVIALTLPNYMQRSAIAQRQDAYERKHHRPMPAATRKRLEARMKAKGGGGLSAPHLSKTAKLLAIWWGVMAVLSPLLLAVLLAAIIRRKVRNRDRREYALFEIHLSMHDTAKKRDVEDMVEALANAVREFPEQRAREGQPYIAFELHYGPADSGLEWTLAVRCERDLVRTVDGILSGAYQDVRVGYVLDGEPQPLRGELCTPGHVLRFRKERPFIYALSDNADEDSSPPIEAIAQAQVALGKPSTVRFQMIPAPRALEAYARHKYHRYENKLVRSEAWGVTEAGLRDQLNRTEMTNAKRTQDKSLFWLEVTVAADTREDANRVAAAVVARRGDNRLHRRWMMARQDLYRGRFATAYPPLWPTLSLRSLVSAAEIAHLIELPSARMKGVPVRRVSVPRLIAPPEVVRTDTPIAPGLLLVDDGALPLPPAAALAASGDTAEFDALPPAAAAGD